MLECESEKAITRERCNFITISLLFISLFPSNIRCGHRKQRPEDGSNSFECEINNNRTSAEKKMEKKGRRLKVNERTSERFHLISLIN